MIHQRADLKKMRRHMCKYVEKCRAAWLISKTLLKWRLTVTFRQLDCIYGQSFYALCVTSMKLVFMMNAHKIY